MSKIKMAICYDFDGTLAPGNMHEHGYLPEFGIAKDVFWHDVKEFAKDNDIDEICAYMYKTLEVVSGDSQKKKTLRKEDFENFGKKIKLFEGVEGFFNRINEYAKNKQVAVEHYIISSGIKEIISGTSISNEFKHIFACKYIYDSYGKPIGIGVALNYTNKTQCLFRINKGILNTWDNENVNKYMEQNERPIPFERMVYIGDGDTDIPCMKMVNHYNGYSIVAYTPKKKGAKDKAHKLIKDNRAQYCVKADYSENSDIDKLIKLIIDKVSCEHSLNQYSKV